VLFHFFLEHTDDVAIVGFLSETQTSAVVHELLIDLRLILAKIFNRNFFLFLFNVGIFLSLRSSWKALPWQRALQEIKQNMTNGFKIISSGLLVSNMSVYGGISSGSCQVLAISERNVLSVRRFIAFCKTEIDNINCIFSLFSATDHKIVWFNVSVNNSLLVDNFNSFDHLSRNVEDSA
jgi:hypothetical protein